MATEKKKTESTGLYTAGLVLEQGGEHLFDMIME